MSRIVTVFGVVFVAVALAGCAATGTGASGSTSATGPAGSTVAATPNASAPSSRSVAVSSMSATQSTPTSISAPTAATPTELTGQEQPATTATSAVQPPEDSSAVPTATDGSDGWYDTWGWVSPQTAVRALAAGIAEGQDVRDDLRCGLACGESPTAAEIQAKYIVDHPDNPNASIEAYEAATAACPGYFIRANCYADAEAARAAGEGE